MVTPTPFTCWRAVSTRLVICEPKALVNIWEAEATGPGFPFHHLSRSSPLGCCSVLSAASPAAFPNSPLPTLSLPSYRGTVPGLYLCVPRSVYPPIQAISWPYLLGNPSPTAIWFFCGTTLARPDPDVNTQR